MIELWQFRFSPYNEKARWGLALKGVDFSARTVLPGPHAGRMRRLSGQTRTPVLVMDQTVIPNSSDILAALERRYPKPAIAPADPVENAHALELQQWLDDDIGPRLRKVVLHSMMGAYGYIAETFAGDQSWPMRTIYRIVLPLAAQKIRKGNGIGGPEDIADGHVAISEALEFVAPHNRNGRYLVGACFSIADLTAASILAPVVNPDHPAMKRPEPMPPATRDLIERYNDHPGAEWVRDIYRDHRP
jgi:glutathione S-transferase